MSNEPDWLEDLYAEGGDEQPPAELDDRIRAAARQPVPRRWYSNPARLAALATAASLVIAASVIYFDPAFFEPVEETLPAAPVESLVEDAAPAEVPGRAPALKTSPQKLAEPKRLDAERYEAADRIRQIEEIEVTAELERRCGPLPGAEQDRTLHYDGADWLVIVRIGEDVGTWRCRNGAWIETGSEEQQPEPRNHQ
jgi:hypothetical protein